MLTEQASEQSAGAVNAPADGAQSASDKDTAEGADCQACAQSKLVKSVQKEGLCAVAGTVVVDGRY